MSPPPAPSRETSAPLAVVSHRANAGYYPENTLLGIEAAIREGAHAIEVDVRATSDGALVLMHDETLERVTGDPRPIAAVALADLEGLRVHGGAANHPPEPIPTLEDALHVIDGRAAIVIDFVIEEVAQDCVDLVNGAGAGEWTWWTAHPPRLASMLAESCHGSRSYLGWTPRDGIAHAPAEAVDLAERHGLAGLMANHRYVDRTAIEYAHRRGVTMCCWTVNDPKRMEQLVRLGVDGITTDYPARLIEVARRARPVDR